MSLRSFLLGYLRPYSGRIVAALSVTVLYTVTTVLLLALLRPIFSQLLLVEESEMPEMIRRGDEAPSGEGESGLLGRLRQYVNLHALFDRGFARFQEALGFGDDQLVWVLPVLFAAVFLLRSLAAFLNGYLFQRIGLGATNDLRNDLYGSILGQSSRFYTAHPSGELISRVSNDVTVMQGAISSRLLDLFQQSVTLVGLVWYLFSTHFQLAFTSLVMVPAVVYPIFRFGKGMRRTSRRSQERLAEVSSLVAEAVRGHRVVKAFGMERFEQQRFREATARHLRQRLRAQLLASASSPVMESLIAIGSAAFLIYAGHAVRSGKLNPAELVTFLAILVLVYDPIRKLNKVNLVLQESLAAAQRILDLMRVPKDVVERPGARILESVGEGIGFEGVAFAYESEAVLKEIDLRVQKGETVALVGSSGAGKSTLVNLVPRFYDPDQGRVSIAGVDLREVTLESLRALIGIVTQDTVLFNDTVRGNIAYGRHDLPLERVREAARAAYAEDFVEELPEGYETVIGESGAKLSGGQRQRLAIARALIKDPPILILDEATSHLDSEAEALVQKALANLMTGRTALVIAHRLSTVRRADRIVVMEGGRIIEQGGHAELLAANGAYRRLHNLQFRASEAGDLGS